MEQKYYAAVDIGGTNTACGIVDAGGRVIARSSFPTWSRPCITDFVDTLHDTLAALCRRTEGTISVSAIGICAPNVDLRGTVALCENLPWQPPVPLARLVRERFGLPVATANDANAAALGEMRFGAARGLTDFITITLGTGVGSGIVAGGRLLTGARGLAGELGHVRVPDNDGRLCGCGRRGCLEAYCSATGLARTARKMLEAEPRRHSALRGIDPERLTSRDVFLAAQNGDTLAAEIFEYTGGILGSALADFVTFSDPQAFVIFGGLARSGELLMRPVREAFRRNIMPMWSPGDIAILPSGLPEGDAALLGAAALALGPDDGE